MLQDNFFFSPSEQSRRKISSNLYRSKSRNSINLDPISVCLLDLCLLIPGGSYPILAGPPQLTSVCLLIFIYNVATFPYVLFGKLSIEQFAG